MWFAALNYGYHRSPRTVWFENLMMKILQGEPEVLALLESNPFPDKPPKYLRAKLYHYEFAEPRVRWQEDQWWQREELGLYFPEVSLR